MNSNTSSIGKLLAQIILVFALYWTSFNLVATTYAKLVFIPSKISDEALELGIMAQNMAATKHIELNLEFKAQQLKISPLPTANNLATKSPPTTTAANTWQIVAQNNQQRGLYLKLKRQQAEAQPKLNNRDSKVAAFKIGGNKKGNFRLNLESTIASENGVISTKQQSLWFKVDDDLKISYLGNAEQKRQQVMPIVIVSLAILMIIGACWKYWQHKNGKQSSNDLWI